MDQEVTAIKVQRRNHQRVNIYLDGEFAFGLSRFVAAWLKPGRKLSAVEIRKLQEEDTYEVAFQKALQFIHHRPRSIVETRRRLYQKGFEQDVIDITIKKLIEKQYLDDFDFSRQWIDNRNEFKPRSQQLLTHELRLKGVADEIISLALEEFGADEIELAYKAGTKKSKQCQHEPQPDFYKKVSGFLSRRGFRYGIVRPTVDRLWLEFTNPTPERQNTNLKME